MTFRPARGWLPDADRSLHLEMRAAVSPGLNVPVFACLRYHGADPFAVYLDIHVDLPEPITWLFARDLLAAGLEGGAGVGDVSVRPADGDAGTLCIALNGEHTTAVLCAPAALIEAFLESTWQLVPPGAEGERVDVDQLLRAILATGEPSA